MQDSYPFIVWSGLMKNGHSQKIGSAIWTFLWCIDKTTNEKNSIGKVLGGTTIKIDTIAKDLHSSYRKVERDLKRLTEHNYILCNRTSNGFIISVTKSKKWILKKGYDKSGKSELPQVASQPDKSGKSELPQVASPITEKSNLDKGLRSPTNQLDKTVDKTETFEEFKTKIILEWNVYAMKYKYPVRQVIVTNSDLDSVVKRLYYQGLTIEQFKTAMKHIDILMEKKTKYGYEWRYFPHLTNIDKLFSKNYIDDFYNLQTAKEKYCSEDD